MHPSDWETLGSAYGINFEVEGAEREGGAGQHDGIDLPRARIEYVQNNRGWTWKAAEVREQ